MRQVCNIAYVAQVESMDEKEFKRFQRELVADPAKGPVSHGTQDLQRMFGGPGAPKHAPAKAPVNPGRKAPASRRGNG